MKTDNDVSHSVSQSAKCIHAWSLSYCCQLLDIYHNTEWDRQIISTDARNHGDSPHSEQMDYSVMAQDVTKLITDLNHKKVTLMGHSMGGKTMMTIALNNVSFLHKVSKFIKSTWIWLVMNLTDYDISLACINVSALMNIFQPFSFSIA